MKKFNIDIKLVSDIVMSIVMIPFVLVSAFILSFAMIFHFGMWWIKRKL